MFVKRADIARIPDAGQGGGGTVARGLCLAFSLGGERGFAFPIESGSVELFLSQGELFGTRGPGFTCGFRCTLLGFGMGMLFGQFAFACLGFAGLLGFQAGPRFPQVGAQLFACLADALAHAGKISPR